MQAALRRPAPEVQIQQKLISMKSVLLKLALAVALVLPAALATAKESRPYTEGPVTQVSYVQVKPGMFDAYMKWIMTERKQLIDAEIKAGIITESKVYTAEAHNLNEADIILTETFPNMAALDGLTDRTDAIVETVFGSMQKSNDAVIDREKMRTVLGTQLIREMLPK
jgi:hypothetical protein